MPNKKRSSNWKLLVYLFVFFSLITAIYGQTYDETSLLLKEVEEGIKEADALEFPILRINDTYMMAKQLFDAQQALEAAEGQANYFFIMEQLTEAKTLLDSQIKVNDEILALKTTLVDVNEESKAHELFNKAQEEFLSERYENIPDIIEEAYKTISEESALDTRIKTFYLLSTATIINFFKINWKEIVSIIWILIILYWLLNKKIRIMFIDRKIKNAKLEITVLKNLIKRTQEEYFHLFNIPEELYFIRVEKFSEFIRNLNSRLPLLMEKRATLQGLEETGEKIPLRERVKEKFKNLFSVFKKKEKGPGLLEPPQAKEERIEEPKKGFWYLLRHIYSFKRFKSALGEIKQKKEEKKKRIETMKNIKKEEIVRKKEEKKRMKKIIQLKKEREEEILKTKKKEQRVLFMAGLIKRIKSIFKKSSHIKLRKSKVIKGIKQRSKAKLSKIDKERKDKEQEYLWFLLKERDKKIEEPQENNSIEPEQKIQEIKKKKSKKNRERKKS